MGLNVPGLEWDANGQNNVRSIDVALDDWHANAIRLPLCQDRWFGKAPDSKDDGTAYRHLVDQAVDEAEKKRAYILLDLHWSDGGQWGQDIGQHTLPDANSLVFWKACAGRYKNRPYVLFDLYNEPIQAPWSVWRNGGDVAETFQGKTLHYRAAGLQQLLDTVRDAGARNLVVAGGLGYSSRLDGIEANALKDPGGNGVVYANHFYPGWESVDSWEKRVGAYENRLPLLVGEFGGSPATLPLDDPKRRVAQVLDVLERHGWSWIAWCMHPSAEPCVISDWNYTPTPYFGVLVKRRLAGQPVPIPPRGGIHLADHTVYDEKLADGWQSWSSAKVDPASTDFAHGGTHSLRVDMAAGQQLQLGVVPFDGALFRGLDFWLYGGPSGGQRLRLSANVMDAGQPPVDLPTLPAGQWLHVEIPFDRLGIADRENVKSFVVRAAGGGATPTFYVDDVTLKAR